MPDEILISESELLEEAKISTSTTSTFETSTAETSTCAACPICPIIKSSSKGGGPLPMISGGTGTTTSLNYNFISSILLLGIFLIFLITFIRKKFFEYK